MGNSFLKQLRLQKHLSQEELADIFQVNKSTISRAESASPSKKVLKKYSKYFSIPLSELYEKVEANTTHIENDIEMVNIQNLINQVDILTIPYFESISAGSEMDLVEDYPLELIQVAVNRGSYSNKKNLIAVRVNGDSMNKLIPDKYIVILDKKGTPKNNDIIAYQIDGNNYGLKRLIQTPQYLVLVPESYNPEYKPKTINIDDIPIREFNIIGKVIGVQADFKNNNF